MVTTASEMAMHDFVGRLADSLHHAGNLEDLVRPLLELLETVTGLESTYFTNIDEEAGQQCVMFARNTRRLRVDEKLVVPWEDTLCRRAMDEQHMYTDDVGGRWADSVAARTLGIVTYASVPVHTADGKLYGTLCAASDASQPLRDDTMPVMKMFSQLIARQIDRERLVDSLRKANVALAISARTDVVTCLPNRPALLDEMRRRVSAADTSGKALLVAFLDLDGFKGINDRYGHDAGDRFLGAVGRRLQASLRDGDFVARLSGDEFVVLSSARRDTVQEVAQAMVERLRAAATGHFALDELVLDYVGPSIGVAASEPGDTDVEALLMRADVDMYGDKRRRKGLATVR